MTAQQLDIVTGAFSNSGAVISRELLGRGHQVRTLTGHPGRAPAATAIESRPLDFGNSGELVRSMAGAHTLYNTYWVRFAHGTLDHQVAVRNSEALFRAAAAAGVQRIVHVSITNASADSPDPYFRGKAAAERALAESGVPHAIVRPAILFGGTGVLLNNIAWLLRRMPVFAIGGRGDYRIRPVHVDDLARLCTELGERADSVTVDAVGPESIAFRDLVAAIKKATGSRAVLLPVPGVLIPPLAAGLGLLLRDTLLNADEYRSMAAGMADSGAPTTGGISVTQWIAAHGAELGRHYASEMDLHYRPAGALA